MAGVEVGQLKRLADATRNYRDLQDISVHGRDCEKPDEAVLEDAIIGVFTDREDIGVRAET